MRRRDFLTVLGALVAASISAARAQKRPPLIGFLNSGAADSVSSIGQMQEIGTALAELGLSEGKDYSVIGKWANSDSSRFGALAAELLKERPRVIVVSTVLAANAVEHLTRSVPIAMSLMNDPVGTGLVQSLAHPGGNITGVDNMVDEVIPKEIAILRELLPRLNALSVMINPTNPSHPSLLDLVRRESAKTQIEVKTIKVASPVELDSAYDELSRQQTGALLILTDNSLAALAETIASRSLALHIPLAGFSPLFAQSGALASYGTDGAEGFRALARIIKKILDGANPANIPVERPTKFNFVLNLKTAKAFGVTVPPSLLVQANQVIG